MSCAHEQFDAKVEVDRIEDAGRFMAGIKITCLQCGLPFQFRGLEPGLHMDGARVSVDGIEARIAIVPQGAEPNPLQAMLFNIAVHKLGFDA